MKETEEKKIRPIPKDAWDKEGVPLHIQTALDTLNEALAIDPLLVTELLEVRTVLPPATAKLFEAHSRIPVSSVRRRISLSALGLLTGALRYPPFIVFVQIADNGTYVYFGVFREESNG